jgi:polar amino acid transport system substrate-binding protein
MNMIKKETEAMKKFWLIIFLAVMILPAAFTTSCGPSQTSELNIFTEDYPPYNFTNENGEVTGQSTEIVRAIMEKTGTVGTIEVLPLSEALELARKGPDTAVYSINRTPQREDLYQWVGPIGSYEQVFYIKKGASIRLNRFEDARNVASIGVYKGDAGAEFLAENGFTNLDESLTDVEALQKLMAGTVQMWLGNKQGLPIIAAQAGVDPADLVELPTVVINADLYIAFSKDVNKSTIESWQAALDSLKEEKDIDDKTEYEKILAKYSGMSSTNEETE